MEGKNCREGSLLKAVKRGFNYSQDGPGNRLVYHLMGCNMRCPWCANPETVYGAETFSIAPREVAEKALEALPICFEGGGVTFTGGEPTVQFEALKEALILLKERGIDTAIESNAAHLRLSELFPYLDHIILDCKHYDDETHRAFTGVSNRTVLENIRAAAASGRDLLIRTPLVGGVNASEEDAEGFLAFFRTLDLAHVKFELLAYHEYGRPKWEKLGRPYTFSGAIPEGRREYFENRFRGGGLTVVRT